MPKVLYAVREKPDSIAKSIKVYDLDGRAYIEKVPAKGPEFSWHHCTMTAAEWVKFNNGPRVKNRFILQ